MLNVINICDMSFHGAVTTSFECCLQPHHGVMMSEGRQSASPWQKDNSKLLRDYFSSCCAFL